MGKPKRKMSTTSPAATRMVKIDGEPVHITGSERAVGMATGRLDCYIKNLNRLHDAIAEVERLSQQLSPAHGEPIHLAPCTTEWSVVFHVTAPSFESAELWLRRAVSLLAENEPRLIQDPDTDEGAFCSGHVSHGGYIEPPPQSHPSRPQSPPSFPAAASVIDHLTAVEDMCEEIGDMSFDELRAAWACYLALDQMLRQ